jgi:hypothetical protein
MTYFNRSIVSFCNALKVDGYQTPSGEYRVGTTGASTVVGFSKQWLSQVHSRNSSTLKALQEWGFTGSQIEGTVAERDGKSGASKVSTISLDDFALLILYQKNGFKTPSFSEAQDGFLVF